MSQLNSALTDVHEGWEDNEIRKVRIRVAILIKDNKIRGVKNHKKARNDQNVANDVPWHSLTYSGVNIVTAVAYQGLEYGIHNLAYKDDKARVVVLELNSLDKVDGAVGVPDGDDEVVGQMTCGVGHHVSKLQSVLVFCFAVSLLFLEWGVF